MSACSRLGSRVLQGPTGQIIEMVKQSMVGEAYGDNDDHCGHDGDQLDDHHDGD